MIDKPEIEQLIRCVEQRYGHVLNTTTDFEVFSLVMKRTCGSEVSPSTLKRIWGYVSDSHQPRLSTLDILAQYAGHTSYTDFLSWLKTSSADNSEYLSLEQIVSSNLSVGDEILIGWSPDRRLLLRYRGDSIYDVVKAENSKIIDGDSFTAGCFIKNHPLIIPSIIRNGEQTPPFIAGREGGLTVLLKK